jgi:hypothetical protein
MVGVTKEWSACAACGSSVKVAIRQPDEIYEERRRPGVIPARP